MNYKQIVILIVVMTSCGDAFAGAVRGGDDLANEKKLSAEYLSKMALETDAQVVEQGIVLRPIFVGSLQEFPQSTDTVKVSYYLSDREGKLIEQNVSDDELAVFPLSKLIKCWQIAVPKMSVGSFYKVSCPSDTAYGDKGAGDGAIKPGAALTFRLTLFGIVK